MKIINYLKKHKDAVNFSFAIYLFVYFVLAFMPSFQRYDVYQNLFLSNSLFDILYKTLVFVILVLISLAVVIVNNIKIDKRFIICILIGFVINAIATWFISYPINIIDVSGTTSVEFNVGTSAKINSLVSSLRFCIMALILAGIAPKALNEKEVNMLLALFIAFTLLAVINSAIFDFDKIKESLSGKEDGYTWTIKSFYMNKNAYGIQLFAGATFCLYFICYKKQHRTINILLYIVFALFAFLSYVRTAFSLIILEGLLCAIYRIVSTENKKKKIIRISILSTILVLALFILLLIVYVPAFNTTKVGNYVKEYFDSFMLNLSTAAGRTEVWSTTFNYLLTPKYILFGYGDVIANQALYASFSTKPYEYLRLDSFHNAFIDQLASGGVIKLGLYIAFIYYFAWRPLRQLENKNGRRYLMIFFAVFTLFSCIETMVLFRSSSQQYAFDISILVLPNVLLNEQKKAKESFTNVAMEVNENKEICNNGVN